MGIGDALPKPEVYFDPQARCYYILNSRGCWIPVTEAALKRKLKAEGFCGDVGKNELLSELERLLNEVVHENDVDYAGPLAGYKTGKIEVQNRRVLVTEGPRFIEPEEGSWVTIEKILSRLLVPPASSGDATGAVQLLYFFSWLKIGMTTLRAGRRRPGQVLVMAGPAGCGKSLVQNWITLLLGGRSAKPYQYMTNATDFNGELFHAEHLMIEDETANFDLRARRHLGANLKGFVVNQSQRCHPKGRQALTLMPFWRVSITVNDEPEYLMVLPPLDDSLQDKMMLMRVWDGEWPMPTETLEQWAAFDQVIKAEMPHFIHFLLKEWVVPKELVCGRYGVKHWHHPDLLSRISNLSPETKLLELIDMRLFPKDTPIWSTWEGKAAELEAELCGPGSNVAHEARKLLLYNTACGQYLSRLERQTKRVKKVGLSEGYMKWEIDPPQRV